MMDCIEQYRLFNSDDLFILTDRENLRYLPRHKGIHHFAIEDYHSDKVSRLESLLHFGPKHFWTVATTRFVYIENFMYHHNLCCIYSFPNDVLIYFDINQSQQVFKRLYGDLAITPCSPHQTIDGFMYIDNWTSLSHMTDFFVRLITRLGRDSIKKVYGHGMVNEMSLMKIYADRQPGRVGDLPILPTDEFFSDFNAIFDPASWGQFVGGTRGQGPGFKSSMHYVGRVLIEHPEYEVVWKLGVPWLVYGNRLVRINNLHIHSKNTHLYRSDVKGGVDNVNA